MLLLEAGNIKKYYADKLIIELKDFKLYTGDKFGVVGLNGSGKTTLLDMLSGWLEPDEGYVKRYCGIGYIRQFSEAGAGDENCDRKLLKEFEIAQKLERNVLSGGEHTRLKIANAFSRENILLFADEPTSNLDFKGIELLKEKLVRLDSFMMISHDRNLLDELCNKILEVRDGKIRIFNGNYSFYSQQCEMEHERAALEYEKYVDAKAGLEAAIVSRQHRAKTIKKAPSRMGNSEARLYKRRSNEMQEKINNAANSLMTRLEKLEIKEKPRELPGIKLDFSLTNPPENKVVISGEMLSFNYGNLTVFKDVGFKVYNGSKTVLWGENGTGKTTLLNLIFTNENKSINIVPKARMAYFRQSFENLIPDKSILENVMDDSVQSETTARTILARLLLQGEAVYKSVNVLSGGEKIKTAFAKLFVSKANVLLLDEPTNYLDMKSIEALEAVLKEYEGTVLFVSHDKAFVNAVADRLLVLKSHSIEDFDGRLEEYEERRNALKGAPSKSTSNGISDSVERTIIQMRLTETIAKLSSSNGNKEALEEEYSRLVKLLR